MWEALSNGEMPYSSVSPDDSVKEMKLNNEELNRPLKCDRELRTLMKRCWPFDPDDRLNFEQIKDELSEIRICEQSGNLQTTSAYR